MTGSNFICFLVDYDYYMPDEPLLDPASYNSSCMHYDMFFKFRESFRCHSGS